MNMITSYDYTNIDIRSTVYNICVSLYLVVVLLVDLTWTNLCTIPGGSIPSVLRRSRIWKAWIFSQTCRKRGMNSDPKEHKWEIQLGEFFQQIYHWRDVQIWEVQFMVNKWPVVWVGSDRKSTAAESSEKPRLRSSGTISMGRKTASDLVSQWARPKPYWVICRYLYYICNIENLTHRKYIYIHGGLDKHVLPLVVGIWHSSKWVKPSKFASW